MAGQFALGAFLLSAAWPLVKKALVALGIGFLTYEGLGLIATQVIGEIQMLWGMQASDVVQILSLAGIPQSLGIFCGSLTARVSFVVAARLGKVL